MPKDKKIEPDTVQESQIDISNPAVKERVEAFMGVPIKDAEEEPKAPEAPAEPTPPTEPTTPPETPAFDAEAERAKIRAEVEAEVKAREEEAQLQAQAIADKVATEKATAERKYIVTPPWETENRAPKGLEEVVAWVREETIAATKEATIKEQEETAANAKAAEEVEAQELAATEQNWNVYWDTQLDDLTVKGKIPAMSAEIKGKLARGETLSDGDASDPGIKARVDLFTLAQKNQNLNLKEVYYEYYVDSDKAKVKQPAGADAPVSAGKGKTDKDTEGFSYEDVHNARSLRDLMPNR